MLDTLRSRGGPKAGQDRQADPTPAPGELRSVRMLAAQMLLVTGVGTTLELLSRARPTPGDPRPATAWEFERRLERARNRPATWAPALVAPLAALAHLVHEARPSRRTEAATQMLDVASIGTAMLGLVDSLGAGQGRATPPLAPVALASAGALALLLRRQERRLAEEHARLERRASVVERLVPRRRARLDRIVVHV